MDQRIVGGHFFRWGSLEKEVVFVPKMDHCQQLQGESRERRAKCKGPEAETSSGTESQCTTSVIRI